MTKWKIDRKYFQWKNYYENNLPQQSSPLYQENFTI